MNSLKTTLSIALFFSLFLGGLAFFFSAEDQIEMSSNKLASVKTKKNNPDNREFEKSEIISKTDKVSDEPSALFNDPAINQAWGLKKSDAARAWTVTHGKKEIVVAVIDTGADLNHEDLKNNLWVNKGEVGLDSKGANKSTNGKDDDENGCVDDVHGCNFITNTGDLTDNHGHGTHISGIIGAEAGNGKGISGIAPQVSLMILKYFDPKVANADNLKNTIRAIQYAIKNGANIINYSGGGTEYSSDEYQAVKEAEVRGILFVAAAGNERSNSDQFHYYPADYKLTNIISVTALDPSLEVLASSNYGIETVDIAAPGQNILSTIPGNNYGFMTGTSQATAFVSGAAALVMSSKPDFKYTDVKKHILSTGDAFTNLASKTKTSRKLNLYKALTVLDQGVAVSGITSKDDSFKTKPNESENGSASNVTQFGKNLLDAIDKGNTNPKPRLGDKKEESY